MMDDQELKITLTEMLNKGLRLEHGARLQYLSHVEMVSGIMSEPVVVRLKEIAEDERKHEEIFRDLIGGYLGGIPTMGLEDTHKAGDLKNMLEVNLKDEKDAIDFYRGIYEKIVANKKKLRYEFETLEHGIRHVIIDEQQHVSELSQLLGINVKFSGKT